MNRKIKVAGCIGCSLLAAVMVGAIVGVAIIISGMGDFLDGPLAEQRRASPYADRSPRWSADGRTIVVNVGYSIFRVSVDNGHATRVASTGTKGQFSPDLSSDNQIAFFDVSQRRSCISVANEGDTEIECHIKIRSAGPWAIPMWSPNGKYLAFSIGQWGTVHSKAVIMSLQGKIIASHTNSFSSGGVPKWSNSGQQVLFAWNQGHKCGHIHGIRCAITVLRLDGTTDTILDVEAIIGTRGSYAPRAEATLSSSVWSSNDQIIYYALQQGIHLPTVIYSLDLASMVTTPIFEMPETTILDLNISPYDDTLMFIAHEWRPVGRIGTDEYLYLLEHDGTGLRRIATSESFGGSINTRQLRASWSPDGELIAVANSRTGELFTIAPDGSGLRLLAKLDVDSRVGPSPEEITEEIESQLGR